MKINILPDDIVKAVRAQGVNVNFGRIRLDIYLRDGKPRWEIDRALSLNEESLSDKILMNLLLGVAK